MPAPLPATPPPQPPPPGGSAQPPTPDARPAIPDGLDKSFDAQFPDDGLDDFQTAPPPQPPEGKPVGGTKPPPEKPAKGTGKGSEKEPQKEPEKEKAAVPAKDKAGTDDKAGAADEGEGAADYTPPQVAKPSELRNWANRMGVRAQKAESKIAALESRLAQMASQPQKTTEEVESLAQELATAKQKLEKYESDLKLKDYERSEEYERDYNKPYQTAVAAAYRDVEELFVTVPDPNDPEQMTERPATIEDFNEIYVLKLGQASKLARQKFGDAASIVLGHRAKIQDLANKAYQAVEYHRKQAGEVETKTKAQQAQQEHAMHRMFNAAREGHSMKFKELYLERDGDSEGNELLTKGRAFADSLFMGGSENMSPQQIAARDAVAHNRLSAFPRLVRDYKKMQAELEDAKATIEELRGSSPGEPDRSEAGGEKQKGTSMSLEEAFDAAVK